MFNEYNPVTYSIYLQSRPDLPEEEKAYYQELIKRLLDKEKEIIKQALQQIEEGKNDI